MFWSINEDAVNIILTISNYLQPFLLKFVCANQRKFLVIQFVRFVFKWVYYFMSNFEVLSINL